MSTYLRAAMGWMLCIPISVSEDLRSTCRGSLAAHVWPQRRAELGSLLKCRKPEWEWGQQTCPGTWSGFREKLRQRARGPGHLTK